jgi:alkylation response protein AidB-like acyl-CoA dehydrogenase
MTISEIDTEVCAASFRSRVCETFEPFTAQALAWEKDGHLPRELFAAIGAAGIFRDRWTAGTAAGLPLARILFEEIAPLNSGAMLALSIHSEVFIHALRVYGGPSHEDTLDAAVAGRAIGCVALTEPGGGSDLYGMETAAVRDGAGWRLTGVKRFTTNVGRASHAVVLARTGHGDHAFSLFLLPLDLPGVTVTRFLDTLGMRSADTGGLTLDVRLGADATIGRVDAGLMYALKLLDYERIAAAFGLVATARAALTLSAAYMRERRQFGKRLFDHQALAHRLADRWAETEAAAALVDAACQAARGDQLPHHLVAAAKLIAAKAATAAADEAIQVFGGRGYTEDYPVERMYRDTRLARIGGGTDEMLRQIICTHLDVSDAAASLEIERYARRFG